MADMDLYRFVTFCVPIVRGSFYWNLERKLPISKFSCTKINCHGNFTFTLIWKRKEKLIYDGSRNSFVNTVSQVSSSQKGSGNLSTVNQNWKYICKLIGENKTKFYIVCRLGVANKGPSKWKALRFKKEWVK